ncbi:hypothetical protein PIB30_036801 [Stylosanthes scabra]|uniref:Uncharacterized protein n=1 Tax=Stylosanthes scabra TaxID=79078 RepID=A0ABU6YE79_9FABA|nr:hypothetical protein [Stylosanthes scabra]
MASWLADRALSPPSFLTVSLCPPFSKRPKPSPTSIAAAPPYVHHRRTSIATGASRSSFVGSASPSSASPSCVAILA